MTPAQPAQPVAYHYSTTKGIWIPLTEMNTQHLKNAYYSLLKQYNCSQNDFTDIQTLCVRDVRVLQMLIELSSRATSV